MAGVRSGKRGGGWRYLEGRLPAESGDAVVEGLEDGAGEEAAGALAGLALVEDGLGGLAPEDDGERLPGGDRSHWSHHLLLHNTLPLEVLASTRV